ncbi:MAG: hypothetical protein J6K13_00620 [Clostridia bacterium]|nr:hypothetical protein [Clostridia bacterium]
MTVFYIYNGGETQYNGNCSVGTPQDVVSPAMNTPQAVESAIPFLREKPTATAAVPFSHAPVKMARTAVQLRRRFHGDHQHP